MTQSGRLFFLSHMQRGIGQHRDETGQITASATLKAGPNSADIQSSLKVMGPEAVTGIAKTQILRRVPDPGSRDMEPNLFASIEFALPDLPWLFSPDPVDIDGHLRPWVVLAVVEAQTGVVLRESVAGKNLPILEIREPIEITQELPDLSESWAWAHIQCEADLDTDNARKAFSDTPELFRSRLVCPRRLKPFTDYIACLVPATLGGVQKGLGLGLGSTPHADAWGPATTRIDLPVYDHWTFRTTARGDFEDLVRKLAPVELSAGSVPLDLSAPGDPRLPQGGEDQVTFQGALVGTSADIAPWDRNHRAEYQKRMSEILRTHRPARSGGTGYNALRDDPVVAPPIWGSYKTGATTAPEPPFDAPAQDVTWDAQLNYSPAERAAAGLGAEAVRRHQEELMTEAWRQAEGLREVNRVFRQTRLSAETGKALKTGKIDKLTAADQLSLAAPARTRIPTDVPGQSLDMALRLSPSPDALFGSAIARLTRKSGPIGKRLSGAAPVQPAVLEQFAQDPVTALSFAEFTVPAQMSDQDQLRQFPAPSTSKGLRDVPETRPSPRLRTLKWRSASALRNTRQIPARQLVKITSSRASLAQRVVASGQTITSAARSATMGFDPVPVLSARLKAKLNVPDGLLVPNAIPSKHLIAPEFDMPGYTLLREISPDAVMPGVSDVPLNSVGLAQVNARFVESWLVGANSEMTREFLWREYPALLSATYFRRFWDTPGGEADIEPISEWGISPLGSNQIGAGLDNTLVLLIKGEVLARFPNLRIYATQAMWDDRNFRFDPAELGIPPNTKDPLFGGWLTKSTAFFAFDIGLREARGTLEMMGPDPGWFFVFEQPPEGLQFGLDVPDREQPGPPDYWSNLHWGHALDDPSGQGQDTHVSIARGVGATELRSKQDGFLETWGRSASAQARITLQPPARVLMHASAMLP
ncbi:hypothetical protein LGQ03_14615 [Loktanella sp. TSTF-M6]|uniref:Uncharacterized protein n=1 Tax=Loktanella gaetbuli TaxID=2881335 RepID=A0ABS8BXS1_9RHOB|nr:hypothetical protein [Loktanella gaetbuli]MCB5200479.1 hypothetical protein [Loktanella gaetbuli]